MNPLTFARERPRPAWALAVALAAALAAAGAGAQQPPAGATPGGARPEVPEPAPAPAPAQRFPIPPAVDRPFDVEEGERLFVEQFVLEGVSDRPQAGIVADELQALIEDLRVERQGLDQIDDDGFTDEEKSQIAEFMRQVVNDPQLDMNFEQYELLIDKLRAERAEREAGMTIGQMQQIATAVTEYYRSAGFILAQAFIPAQEVVDGVVRIEVLEGTLGNVLAEGNETYSDEVLAKPFEKLLDAPVTASGVESAVLTVSDYPGLSMFGVFQPGRKVGATDLVLRVQDEEPYDASVRYDNHGTRFTGERRVFADFTWNNPTRVGDRLSASALKTFWPSFSFFGEVEYERPVFWPGFSVGANYSRNPFSVGAELEANDISGESTTAEVFARKSLLRSRRQNFFARGGVYANTSENKVAKTTISRDDVRAVQGEIVWDNIDTEARAINLATLRVTSGLGALLGGDTEGHNLARNANGDLVNPGRVGGSGAVGSNEFLALYGSYSRLQTLTATQSFLLRLEAQWSNDLLVSTEQYSIGGPSNVRAFNVSEALADSAVFASVEYTIDAPFFADAEAFRGLTWGEILRVSFFSDFAYGRVNDPAVGQRESTVYAGFGAGVSFQLPGEFTGRLQVAHPWGKRVAEGNPNETTDVTQWWFDFTYQF